MNKKVKNLSVSSRRVVSDYLFENPVSVVLVGIGGYGAFYGRTLLEEFPPGIVWLAGAVDPFPGKTEFAEQLKAENVPVYPGLAGFYESGGRADLAVIVSPIHYHVTQSCLALSHGSHVLCDKPLGAVIQEADRLIRIRDLTGCWVRVGYQWSFSPGVQALKEQILRGRYGRPRRFRALCFWPRDRAYYSRNDWAGKRKDPCGAWVLDSPANNAMAHFLHNLLYLAGPEQSLSATPLSVEGETFRAHSIETFDTAACRIQTLEGVEILFYASHVTRQAMEPCFHLEFEKASGCLGPGAGEIRVKGDSGEETRYAAPETDHQFRKLFAAVSAVHRPAPVLCGPEAARAQTLCVNGLHEAVPEAVPFSIDKKRENPSGRVWIEGLDAELLACYEKSLLPGEAGYSWGGKAGKADLSGYRYFPGGSCPGEIE
jgi:predicted dehydrogenase